MIEIASDLVKEKHQETEHLKFKVKNGWTLDFNELTTLYNSKEASIKQQKQIKRVYSKFRKVNINKSGSFETMLL